MTRSTLPLPDAAAAALPADPRPGADAERDIKRQRLLSVLDASGQDAVWLTSPAALAWYLDGARVHTSLLGPPIAAVRVGRDGELVRAFANEVDRLVAEELPAGIATEPVHWFDALVPAEPRAAGEDDLAVELRAARATLLPRERRRFAELGADAAAALTAELSRARPEESERALAARVSAALVACGADPAVIMVAGESRLALRHPLPTEAPLGRRAYVVIGARRHGLIVNATRWIRFDAPTAEERTREAALHAVEATAFRASRPGTALREVLTAIADAYPRHGFAEDEWTRHHQGGVAGYAGRDPRAMPDTTDIIHDGGSFAWNPTAPAQKIEDTVLIDAGQVTVLTRDGAWPETLVDGVPRPLELEL